MARLNVEIVTPERRLAQLQADEVIAPGADGLFGVRPGHAPFLSVLNPGALTVRDGMANTVYFVSGGFVEVGPTVVRVLADAAETKDSIDVPGAQKRVADAETKLKALDQGSAAANDVRELLTREKVRLYVATSNK
jgi:F-type H+-transporting ATPase subunit epsilon